MYEKEVLKEAMRRLAAKASGKNVHQKKVLGRDILATEKISYINILPSVVVDGIQEENPNSPDFGKFFYLPDFDGIDSGIIP